MTVDGQALARLRSFDGLAAMTGALADAVTAGLARGLEARGWASLVVSGGRTPEARFVGPWTAAPSPKSAMVI